MAKSKQEEKEEFNKEELKEELERYINQKIKESFKEELDKSYTKLLRERNHKIFFKNITILILVASIGYLIYFLYQDNYFSKYLKDESKISELSNKEKEESREKINNQELQEDKKDELEELKEEYSNLINKIILNENSTYLKDFYNGKLTLEIKNYISLNNIELKDLTIEDEVTYIDSNLLEEKYLEIFNDDNYQNVNFDFNGLNVRYFKKIDSYLIENELIKKSSNIVREIIDIKKDNEIVTIQTAEGLIKNKKLYNILTNTEIKKYQNDSLINYQNKLNKITYIFKNGKLDSISK